MERYQFSENPIFSTGTAVTIGKFDGVHQGHKKLIESTVRYAKENGIRSLALLIYDPRLPRIRTLSDTAALIEELGMDAVVFCPLTRAFMSLEGEAFLKNTLLSGFSMNALFTGESFRFGYKGACDTEYLKKASEALSFTYVTVPSVYVGDVKASSSEIRTLLAEGDVAKASEFLGYPYQIRGICVHGAQIGRSIGFPTVNIPLDETLFLPAFGVYFCEAEVAGKRCSAIGNLGVKPTVTSEKKPLFEGHILGFSGDLYGEAVSFRLIRFLRPERRFQSVTELKNQIAEDIKTAEALTESSEEKNT